LPEALVHPLAYGLPAFEIALAVLLIAGIATRLVGGVAAVVVAVFIGAIASAAARGLRIDCGCFGGGGTVERTHYTLDIVRDSLLLLVILVIPLAKRSKLAVARHWRLASALAVVVLAGAVGAGIASNYAHAGSVASSAIVAPPGATSAGGVVVGDPAAPVRLIAYEDPQCPICKEFEEINGSTLTRAIAEGKVSVEYRMRSFLGPESVRADNALAAAQAQGKFEALREALYKHQPQEGTGGYTTDDLIVLGASVGLRDSAYVDAVRSMTYAKWVGFVDDRASRDGNTGTPRIVRVGVGPLSPAQTFEPALFDAAIGLR
jgi:protein-disulfide isomerase